MDFYIFAWLKKRWKFREHFCASEFFLHWAIPHFSCSWENLLGVIYSSLHRALLQLRKPTGCDQFIFTLSPTYLSWENLLGVINSSEPLSPTSTEKTYWVWSIHLNTEPYLSWENLPYWVWSIHLYTEPYFNWENLGSSYLHTKPYFSCENHQFIFKLSPT
jgi:hypothetical protein